jgi:hypothetical protein
VRAYRTRRTTILRAGRRRRGRAGQDRANGRGENPDPRRAIARPPSADHRHGQALRFRSASTTIAASFSVRWDSPSSYLRRRDPTVIQPTFPRPDLRDPTEVREPPQAERPP